MARKSFLARQLFLTIKVENWSIDDFKRLDPEISASPALINLGQQADFRLWTNLPVLPDGVLDLDANLACSIAEREVVLPLVGDDMPRDSDVTAKPRRA